MSVMMRGLTLAERLEEQLAEKIVDRVAEEILSHLDFESIVETAIDRILESNSINTIAEKVEEGIITHLAEGFYPDDIDVDIESLLGRTEDYHM